MKETTSRSLWAILICLLSVALAVMITSSMLFSNRYSGDTIAKFSPSAEVVDVAEAVISA